MCKSVHSYIISTEISGSLSTVLLKRENDFSSYFRQIKLEGEIQDVAICLLKNPRLFTTVDINNICHINQSPIMELLVLKRQLLPALVVGLLIRSFCFCFVLISTLQHLFVHVQFNH